MLSATKSALPGPQLGGFRRTQRGYAQVSHRPLAGSCMKQVGQMAGGASWRLGGLGSARGRGAAVLFARAAGRGASTRTRAVSRASPRSATTAGNQSATGIRVYTPD